MTSYHQIPRSWWPKSQFLWPLRTSRCSWVQLVPGLSQVTEVTEKNEVSRSETENPRQKNMSLFGWWIRLAIFMEKSLEIVLNISKHRHVDVIWSILGSHGYFTTVVGNLLRKHFIHSARGPCIEAEEWLGSEGGAFLQLLGGSVSKRGDASPIYGNLVT